PRAAAAEPRRLAPMDNTTSEAAVARAERGRAHCRVGAGASAAFLVLLLLGAVHGPAEADPAAPTTVRPRPATAEPAQPAPAEPAPAQPAPARPPQVGPGDPDRGCDGDRDGRRDGDGPRFGWGGPGDGGSVP